RGRPLLVGLRLGGRPCGGAALQRLAPGRPVGRLPRPLPAPGRRERPPLRTRVLRRPGSRPPPGVGPRPPGCRRSAVGSAPRRRGGRCVHGRTCCGGPPAGRAPRPTRPGTAAAP